MVIKDLGMKYPSTGNTSRKYRYYLIKCDNCGVEWDSKSSSVYKKPKHYCKTCTDKMKSKKQKMSYDTFVEKVTAIHGDSFTLPTKEWWDKNYRDFKTKYTVTCNNCGVSKVTDCDKMIVLKRGCKVCKDKEYHNSRMISLNEANERARLKNAVILEYGGGSSYKSTFKCERCGNIWSATLDSLCRIKYGCPKCGKKHSEKSQSLSHDEFIEKAVATHGNVYDYSKVVYTNHKTKVEIVCPKHGSFWQKPNKHLSVGQGCPKCANHNSKGEQSLRDFIEGLGFSTEKYRDKKYEIDVYLPELNIGFEYNGLYWHSRKKKGRRYHQEKSKYFMDKGIKLFHVWEDHWESKRDILESMIKARLGIVEHRVYARKCYVDIVRPDIAQKFLDANHIQGGSGGSIHLGLYNGDELVSLVSFLRTTNRDTGVKEWHIAKFSSLKGYSVIGGFSKIWKYFLKHYDPDVVITFHHFDFNNSYTSVYSKAGFTFEKLVEPTYWYFEHGGTERIHRRLFQKKRLIKRFDWATMDMTENEITERAGYFPVHDAGNVKWVWVSV